MFGIAGRTVALFSCKTHTRAHSLHPPACDEPETFTASLSVDETDAAFLRSVRRISPLLLPGVRGPPDLLSTRIQDGLNGLPTDAVNHFIDRQPAWVMSSTRGSKICPFAFASSSTLAAAI